MDMDPMERRKYRSNQPATALRFQLEATRRLARLEALALADRSGLLVAYAGEPERCEELGAVAPVLARAQHLACNQEFLDGSEITVRPLDFLGEPLFLVSTGGGAVRDRYLERSAQGVRRILQQQAA
jgi:hypothetical protein